MALAGVIFDFDGVLADSEPVHLQVFQTVLDSIGITLTAEEYYEKYLGYSDRDAFVHVLQDRGADDRGRQPRGAARDQEGTVPAGDRRSRAVPGRGRVHRAGGRARAGGHRLRRPAARDRADPRRAAASTDASPSSSPPARRRAASPRPTPTRAPSTCSRASGALRPGRIAVRRRRHRGLRVGSAVGPRRRPADDGRAHLVRQGQPAERRRVGAVDSGGHGRRARGVLSTRGAPGRDAPGRRGVRGAGAATGRGRPRGGGAAAGASRVPGRARRGHARAVAGARRAHVGVRAGVGGARRRHGPPAAPRAVPLRQRGLHAAT